MEKLSGVHPDVELRFITKEIAALKLPVVVREEIKNYLNQLSSSETLREAHLSNFVKLISQIQEDGIEVIWQHIQPKVADRLFDEFKSLYMDDRENLDFLDFVDVGQYTPIENLNGYKQQIVSSKENRKHCSQVSSNSTLFFSQKISRDNDTAKESVLNFITSLGDSKIDIVIGKN